MTSKNKHIKCPTCSIPVILEQITDSYWHTICSCGQDISWEIRSLEEIENDK